ncbi:MBL fold metallo-hydrolase [Amycolatopsis sp. NPDC051106]|jgi:L-ascorbate metabolism protein UlaG (beta-lactamase superfamily)|uniref:MBL fold metallo-hydrolase n=1 Tax=unclassified Amycolatopsis TaxID=2618356 RepID=UPI00344A670D
MSPLDLPSGDSLTFVGTATTLLRLGPFTLLTDPNFLHRGQWSYFGQGLFSRRRTEPALQPRDLPPLTAVVLSHLHGDHFDRVASRELPRDVPILTTGHAAARLQRRGFHAPLPLPTWHSESFSDGDARLTVTSVPARHGPGVLDRVLPPVMGSVLEYRATPEADPLRIYLSGDTVLHDELGTIRDRFPDLDLAVVHLGGTRAFGVLVTLDHRGGVDLLNLLEPRRAVPVHFDDYGLFRSPVSNFLQEVRIRKPRTEVHLLQRGEVLAL